MWCTTTVGFYGAIHLDFQEERTVQLNVLNLFMLNCSYSFSVQESDGVVQDYTLLVTSDTVSDYTLIEQGKAHTSLIDYWDRNLTHLVYKLLLPVSVAWYQ